jgi:hypothetical protein
MIDSIEEEENENDTKSNDEPDPRTALLLMLNKRSNLLSSSTSSETGSKAVDNDESEQDHPEDEIDTDPKLKDDPVYAKYYKMIRMGLSKEVAQHAMIRDKLDPRCVLILCYMYMSTISYYIFFLT